MTFFRDSDPWPLFSNLWKPRQNWNLSRFYNNLWNTVFSDFVQNFTFLSYYVLSKKPFRIHLDRFGSLNITRFRTRICMPTIMYRYMSIWCTVYIIIFRCRDYDEKGFCLRGDLCKFDHGSDAVVLEVSSHDQKESNPAIFGFSLDHLHTIPGIIFLIFPGFTKMFCYIL